MFCLVLTFFHLPLDLFLKIIIDSLAMQLLNKQGVGDIHFVSMFFFYQKQKTKKKGGGESSNPKYILKFLFNQHLSLKLLEAYLNIAKLLK